jgi:hypothetical protein
MPNQIAVTDFRETKQAQVPEDLSMGHEYLLRGSRMTLSI